MVPHDSIATLEQIDDTAAADLSAIADYLRASRFSTALRELVSLLHAVHQSLSAGRWQRWIRERFLGSAAQTSLARGLSHLRALPAPELLEGRGELIESMVVPRRAGNVPLLAAISQLTFVGAWRGRVATYARELDTLANGRALSLGSGSLPEGSRSRAVTQGGVTLTGVCSDPFAVSAAAHAVGATSPSLLCRSPEQVLVLGELSPDHNLCYVAYALERTTHEVAVKVLRRALLATAPGGRVVASNLTGDDGAAAFMDAVIGVPLACRTARDMDRLVLALPDALIDRIDLALDDSRVSWILRLTRR